MKSAHNRLVRFALMYLLLANLVPGIWALFFPYNFYNDFPGFGHQWVAVDGPYNEHLIRDVGAFFLAMTTLILLTLIAPRWITARASATCLLVFNLPHLLYHLAHLHMLPLIDQIGNVVTLSLSVLVPMLILLRPTFISDAVPTPL